MQSSSGFVLTSAFSASVVELVIFLAVDQGIRGSSPLGCAMLTKSDDMKNGKYILIKAPENWEGKKYSGKYCYEHHFIYWKHYRIIPNENQVIHHENEIETDNNIDNLKLMSVSKHNSLHLRKRKGRKPIKYIELTCSFCNKKFLRKSGVIITKIKKGQKHFYCNRSCMASHFGNGRPINE